jgi:PAS domain S-box-containing protein
MTSDPVSSPIAPPDTDRVQALVQGRDFEWVVAVLRQHRKSILSRWLNAAAQQTFHAGRREQAVADHIPSLLDALLVFLERSARSAALAGAPMDDPAVLRAAQGHADMRFGQGLSAPEIATEFRLLRHEIGWVLRQAISDTAPLRDVVAAELLVHDVLDAAVILALAALNQHEVARLRAEQALRESQELFRLLVENVQDYAIYVLDAAGRVTSWNAGAERIKGYTAEEITGRSYEMFFTPEDRATEKPRRLLARASAEGRVQDEGWHVRRDTTRFWADTVITALHDDTGVLRGYAKVTRDMTERKMADAEHQAFIATLTHDLRNPLATISGLAQVLRRQAGSGSLTPDRLARRATAIEEASTRVVARLDELLDAVRLGQGQTLPLLRAPADLVELARRAVAAHQLTTEVHHLRLELRVATLVGEWDRARLERVLDNLLGNALKYSPDDGEIVVTVSREHDAAGQWAVFSVRDQGMGVPASDVPYIFERYRRASNIQGIPGSGIGLFAVRQIVEQHGGSVTVDSVEGEGSTFTVRLPLAAE